MAPKRNFIYECSNCGREVGQDNLRAKNVRFKEMGRNGSVIRSRIVAWLCIVPQVDGTPSCMESDPDYSRPMYAASPGMADTELAKEEGYVS